MQEHRIDDGLRKIAKLLTPYKSQQKIGQFLAEVNLLSGEHITFEDIHKLFSKFPLSDFHHLFKSLNLDSKEINEFKKYINNLLDNALANREHDLAKLNQATLAKLYADLQLPDEDLPLHPEYLSWNKEKLINEIMKLSKIQLVTGTEKISPRFLHWQYMKIATQEKEPHVNLAISDQQEQRFCGYMTYYQNLSPSEFLDDYWMRFDAVIVGTDESAQYTQKASKCFMLHPQTKDYEERNLSDIDPKFVFENVTNCHLVIIRDIEKDRYWLLHVSPSSVYAYTKHQNDRFPAKLAYTDLKQIYPLPELGIDPAAKLDVIVFEHKQNFKEDLFLRNIRGTISSFSYNHLDFLSPNKRFDVVFDPTAKSITIKQGQHCYQIPNVFIKETHLDEEEIQKKPGISREQ